MEQGVWEGEGSVETLLETLMSLQRSPDWAEAGTEGIKFFSAEVRAAYSISDLTRKAAQFRREALKLEEEAALLTAQEEAKDAAEKKAKAAKLRKDADGLES